MDYFRLRGPVHRFDGSVATYYLGTGYVVREQAYVKTNRNVNSAFVLERPIDQIGVP